MIYTSNYNNINKYNKDRFILVSISRTQPKNFNGLLWHELMPSNRLLNEFKSNKINWNEYKMRYNREVLDNLNPIEISQYLFAISQRYDKKDIVLLCYCSDYEHCHRSIVSRYLNKIGIYNKELIK